MIEFGIGVSSYYQLNRGLSIPRDLLFTYYSAFQWNCKMAFNHLQMRLASYVSLTGFLIIVHVEGVRKMR